MCYERRAIESSGAEADETPTPRHPHAQEEGREEGREEGTPTTAPDPPGQGANAGDGELKLVPLPPSDAETHAGATNSAGDANSSGAFLREEASPFSSPAAVARGAGEVGEGFGGGYDGEDGGEERTFQDVVEQRRKVKLLMTICACVALYIGSRVIILFLTSWVSDVDELDVRFSVTNFLTFLISAAFLSALFWTFRPVAHNPYLLMAEEGGAGGDWDAGRSVEMVTSL